LVSLDRFNLNGTCVGYDGLNGICDSSSTDLKGVYVANNAKGRCEGEYLCNLLPFVAGLLTRLNQYYQHVQADALPAQYLRSRSLRYGMTRSVPLVKRDGSCKVANASRNARRGSFCLKVPLISTGRVKVSARLFRLRILSFPRTEVFLLIYEQSATRPNARPATRARRSVLRVSNRVIMPPSLGIAWRPALPEPPRTTGSVVAYPVPRTVRAVRKMACACRAHPRPPSSPREDAPPSVPSLPTGKPRRRYAPPVPATVHRASDPRSINACRARTERS
jgi:hypothetical protein